jgi:hypothetical protein
VPMPFTRPVIRKTFVNAPRPLNRAPMPNGPSMKLPPSKGMREPGSTMTSHVTSEGLVNFPGPIPTGLVPAHSGGGPGQIQKA